MERESGLELDTYFNTCSIPPIMWPSAAWWSRPLTLTLERVGRLPLPVDVRITSAMGEVTDHHIPQVVTQGTVRSPKESPCTTRGLDEPDLHLDLPRSLPGCTVKSTPPN